MVRIGFGAFLACAALMIAAPASAGMLILGGNPATAINAGNDFDDELHGDFGFDSITHGDIEFDRDGTVQFYFLGAESGLTNRFNYGPDSFAERNQGWQVLSSPLGSPITVTAGTLLSSFASFGASNTASPTLPGDTEFGVFFDGSVGRADLFSLAFGHDDDPGNRDDNHDDIMIFAQFSAADTDEVPEPAALGLIGLGAAALGLRRRRKTA